jgi:hypothetical protein
LLSFASFLAHTPIYCSRTRTGFESQSDHPPTPKWKLFLFSVAPAYFRKDFLTPDHLVTKQISGSFVRHFYFAMTNLWA